MFHDLHHFQQLSSCVGSNSCGVYFNTAPGDTNGLWYGATHLQDQSVDSAINGPDKGFLADSNSTVDYSMATSNQGMWTTGSAINTFWSDTTDMDNLRTADITATSVAGSLEEIGINDATTNVRGGHTVHTGSGYDYDDGDK